MKYAILIIVPVLILISGISIAQKELPPDLPQEDIIENILPDLVMPCWTPIIEVPENLRGYIPSDIKERLSQIEVCKEDVPLELQNLEMRLYYLYRVNQEIPFKELIEKIERFLNIDIDKLPPDTPYLGEIKDLEAGLVRVMIYLKTKDIFLPTVDGIIIEGRWDGLVQAKVPINSLDELAVAPEVQNIGVPSRVFSMTTPPKEGEVKKVLPFWDVVGDIIKSESKRAKLSFENTYLYLGLILFILFGGYFFLKKRKKKKV